MAAKPHILVFPYPAPGHMLPLLDLAAELDGGGDLAVTVAVTTANRHLLDPLLSRCPSISPLVLPFPAHASIPPGVENCKDLPPNSFGLMIHALAALHRPLLLWARAHPSPPSFILSDMFLGWTNALAADLAVPRIVFCPSGALTISIAHALWRSMPQNPTGDPHQPVRFPLLPGAPVYPWAHLSLSYRRYKEGDTVPEFVKEGWLHNMRSWGYVLNTFHPLEGRYIEHLRRDLGHPRVWAVGPIRTLAERGGSSAVPAGELLAWLDRFEAGTVLYVCFGSQAKLLAEQSVALATALESSGVRFLWCARGGENCIPEGFEGRTEERGMVVRGWAPQVAVLGHAAVGWFLTHCGWNSTMEAVAAGVAMLTWPMTADQFYDARLLVEEARVAVPACEGCDTVPDSDRLARVLTETVRWDRPERARAAELQRKAMEAAREGGSSYRDLEGLVEELKSQSSQG